MAELPDELTRKRLHLIGRLAGLAIEEFGTLGETTATDEHFRALHARYDRNLDGYLDPDELRLMLADADVASFFERGWWVRTIFQNADVDVADGALSFDEFLRGIRSKGKIVLPTQQAPGGGGSMTAIAIVGALMLLGRKRGRR
jgi:hypothetical protein